MNHENAFARSLSRSIPPNEAAGYFQRLKTAGWADPPDETGSLEGQFTAPLPQVIAKLTEVISAKFRLMVAYHIYAESMRDPAQHAIGEVFHEHAEMERAAAEAYLKRAATLGGPVHLPEIEPPPASSDPIGILKIVVRAEQEAIALQSELKAMVGDQNPLSFQIEQFMIEDQHHHDEAWQMLPQDSTSAPLVGAGSTEPAAAGAPAGPVDPMEEPPPAPPEADLSEEEAPPPPPAAADAGPPPEMAGMPGGEGGPPPPKADSKPKTESKPESKSEDKPKPKSESKPSDKEKEATARLRFKLAGMADDIIGGMDPNYKKRLFEEAKRNDIVDRAQIIAQGRGTSSQVMGAPLLRSPASAEPGLLAHLGSHAGLIGGGAALGGLSGALGGFNRSKSQEKRLASGGPIGRWAADHPGSSGTIQGALTGAGAMGGALALPKLLRPVMGEASDALIPLGMMGGALLPQLALHAADRSLQRGEQAAAKEASARFRMALTKLALNPSGMPEAQSTSQDPGAAPTPDQQNAVMPQPSMAAPGQQPPMATEPGARQYEGTNYLEAEATARRAQAENEAQFYRQQATDAHTNAASMGGQVQQIQGQLDQLQQQVDESQNQIMAANQEAMTANDQMLNQATMAARMRMGMQQLRAQMMEIASQDPEQLATAAGGPTPMDVGQQAMQAQQGAAGAPAAGAQAPMDPGGIDPATGQPAAAPGADPGTPAAAPDAQAQEGSVPSGAGGPEGKSAPEPKEDKKEGGETTVSIKKGSVGQTLGQELTRKLPYMGAGALVGAGMGAMEGRKVPSLQEKVDALKGQQDGGFARSLELAKAQMSLQDAESAKQHPIRSALKGGLAGAGLGAALGTAVPALINGGQRLGKNIQTIRGNL
jgi:bacterioferritin (cytochrome b1)/outer membrane murein-binding lipoprotein Lpp